MADTPLEKAFMNATSWRDEAITLRDILLDGGLEEQMKWGKPCYSAAGGGNIVIIQRMKSFLALMFFKGALLKDPKGLLREQGPNSRSAKRLEFTSVEEISRQASAIKALLKEAIAVENAGLSVKKLDPSAIDLPDELERAMAEDAALSNAFKALTPGRQRGYALYIADAKQSATRAGRVEKCRQKILDGKGFHDR